MEEESSHDDAIAVLLAAFEAHLFDDYTEDYNIYTVALTVREILDGLVERKRLCEVEVEPVEEQQIAVQEK